MEFLKFIFSLGVVIAIFGFIWGFLNIGYSILRGQNKNIGETYLLKGLKYFFMVNVIFLFCYESNNFNINQLVISALILLTYFLGKLQNQQQKKQLFKFVANGIPLMNTQFNLKAEIGVISFAILSFALFFSYPFLAENNFSNWMYENITSIEKTPFFGFIFKIIGAFFIWNIFSKMFSSFGLIASKQNGSNQNDSFEDDNQDKEDKFDDYEEIK